MISSPSMTGGSGATRLFTMPGYVPVLAKKPGVLRNGAPFKQLALPPALERLRGRLKGSNDGDRQMVKILTAATVDGLDALEAAAAEALAQGVTSADVVLNILARSRSAPVLPSSAPIDNKETQENVMLEEQWQKGLETIDQVYGPGFHKMMESLKESRFNQEVFANQFGNLWADPALSLRDKRLMVLGATATLGRADLIEIQMVGALINGELLPNGSISSRSSCCSMQGLVTPPPCTGASKRRRRRFKQ